MQLYMGLNKAKNSKLKLWGQTLVKFENLIYGSNDPAAVSFVLKTSRKLIQEDLTNKLETRTRPHLESITEDCNQL